MCGFAGFTNPLSESFAENRIKRMLQPIEHRGPDSNLIHISKKIALGHYRLSIIDLKGGQQPRIDKEDNSYLVFNGEIYGYKEQANLLRAQGIFLKDNSDTEVLFQSLKYFGVEKTLKNIDGMFAFAYYEGKSETLWLARDPAGEKPLYYSVAQNSTYFGSELSSLAACKNALPFIINEEALFSYLHLDYIPKDKTIITNINKVLPGEVVKINNNNITKNFYFKINLNNKINISKNDAINRLENLLEESINKRLIADVPIGIFLSGGIDSSLIAYYAKKYNNNIKSFTIKMNNDSYDESEHAKLVADNLGMKNYIAAFDDAAILQSLSLIENKLDEPLSDPSILPTFLLSKFAKEHVKVALSGDGADELFCGYAPFKSIRYLKTLSYIPKSIGSMISSIAGSIPTKDSYMSYHFILKHVSRGFGWPSQQQVFRWMAPLSDRNISKLLNKDYDFSSNTKNNWDQLLQQGLDNRQEVTNLLSKMFFEYYLPNDILTKVDRASMYNGLEVRSPFLSKSLIEFSYQLSNKHKLNQSQTKLILRELSTKILPKNISSRKKHGFAIPLAKMLRGPLKEKVEDTLLSTNGSISKYFNRPVLENLLKNHFKGIDNRKPIWAIYMLYKSTERLSKL